ncbi:adenylyl-sulfate kinase [Azospirillum agricola]|uniref:adenylyl-sulfate kinase n=1 Tax=Azospirillum agricola TaxID=1720247 RepID=UPI000A0EF50C|nr:adenylyl-sulfate kinase [Azospirillum agricola]MBP2227336.1 bifunctional enzyme CysN/CysC [Azospirillum agricola]SMH59971.1 adenylylsulfate kinase /sulfate adenylyltransferase subunit 1 [Azospirillum lipoferum]
MPHSQLRIVIVGHVDHGKSTLIGRLLNDTGSLPDGKVEQVQEMSRKRGMPFEWAFVMDALQAERDQGITIDTTQIHFKTAQRPYVIIDAPGHTEFLKNMVTGASQADAALLVIDAGEGALEQSRRHAYLLHLLGVRQVAVVINKMDRVEFSQARYETVAHEIKEYLAELGLFPKAVIPISARNGDNIVARNTEQARWYLGPTVIEQLDSFRPQQTSPDQPLRFPLQDVYKPDDRRILAGRVESGRLRVGDTLRFAPTGASAKVVSIEAWNHPETVLSAQAGQSIGVTLDKRIFAERGHVAYHEDSAPVLTHRLSVRLFWLVSEPMQVGRTYTLKIATAEHRVTVEQVTAVINVEDLTSTPGKAVHRNEVAEVVLRSRSPIAVDLAAELPRTGRGVLLDGHDVVGGCLVVEAEDSATANITEVSHTVSAEERSAANGHRGGILWLTGLSGAGKSTLAMALERALFDRGWQTFVLDGDNVRNGLNAGLGFSPDDRAENIRRVAETAKLFADAGMVVIASLISPLRDDRARARVIGGDRFHEVHVAADLATCEERDPKGLYKKARAGEIAEFTGVSAPYEAPEQPELVIDTAALSRSEALAHLLDYVDETLGKASLRTGKELTYVI